VEASGRVLHTVQGKLKIHALQFFLFLNHYLTIGRQPQWFFGHRAASGTLAVSEKG